jgi:hypothetical protein
MFCLRGRASSVPTSCEALPDTVSPVSSFPQSCPSLGRVDPSAFQRCVTCAGVSHTVTTRASSSVVLEELPADPVGIDTIRTCKNKGCENKYTERENHPSACIHHPGPPVFHDRQKVRWSPLCGVPGPTVL